MPVRVPRGCTCFTVRAAAGRLASKFSRHQLKVMLMSTAEGTSSPSTLGICRIPLALLLSAAPTTTTTFNNNNINSSIGAESCEVQAARGTSECVNESGVFGHIAFKLQLKRLAPGYCSPLKLGGKDVSVAASTKQHQQQQLPAAEGKERLLQVGTVLKQ